MIKIEMEFASGEQARAELLALVGIVENEPGTQTFTWSAKEAAIEDEKIAENFSAPKTEIDTTEAVAEQVKKVRRTKEQIAAEKAAKDQADNDQLQQGDADQNDSPDGGDGQMEEEAIPTVTIDHVKKRILELSRVGKREQGRAILNKFGADSLSNEKPLDPQHYAAVLDELNAVQ